MENNNYELPIITDLKELALEFSSNITEEQQEKLNALINYVSIRLDTLMALNNEKSNWGL